MSVEIEKLTLPVFIGTLLNWTLFGILGVQVGIYFVAFPKDRAYSKILVLFVFLIEILETLANTRDAVRLFGAGWGNRDVLDEVGWAWFSVPIIGSISAAVGQLFFAWRIYIIGRTRYIPALILAITSVQLGAGIWSGIEICLARRFSDLQSSNLKPTVTWLAATGACDLIIVSSTAFYLMKSWKPEFRKTNAILSKIIKLTVETGMLCALFALLDLYLFATYKGTNYHLSLCTGLSKVYSNSILLILNSRAHVGYLDPTEMGHHISDIVFTNGTKISRRAEMNRSIDTSSSQFDTEGHEGNLGV
ncbi:hypothetical protein DFH09DRAFT_1386350 [Mycena vulgaris]|nr:hypothetical protein DFH09DRAFT_1386350 [Mycena vulgaris]